MERVASLAIYERIEVRRTRIAKPIGPKEMHFGYRNVFLFLVDVFRLDLPFRIVFEPKEIGFFPLKDMQTPSSLRNGGNSMKDAECAE